MKDDKIIVTAAVTGAIHTPTMSPHLPITPDEIAEEAIKAAEAGASVVHVHARDPETGEPSSDLGLFREILTKIKKNSDVIVCVTTGGNPNMSIEERMRVVPEFEPEMASFNLGSLNFALYPILDRVDEFQYEWEREWLESTEDLVHKNTFKDLHYIGEALAESRTQPEIEIYDMGQINNARQLLKEGVISKPLHLQFVMGILGGIDSSPENLVYLKNNADKHLGRDEYSWSVIGAGRAEFPLGALAATMGGHVRVGLEDNLYLGKGEMAESNAELVEKIVHLADELTGRQPATPDEVRGFLELKGKDQVNF